MTKNSPVATADYSNKKHGPPSQKRIQKQQRQQQQSSTCSNNNNNNKTDSLLSSQNQTKNSNNDSVNSSDCLDAKVNAVTDKNEYCKLKISSKLDKFAEKAQEIKAGINQALERQSKRAEDDAKVSASVEELKERLVKLTASAGDDENSDNRKSEQLEVIAPEVGSESAAARDAATSKGKASCCLENEHLAGCESGKANMGEKAHGETVAIGAHDSDHVDDASDHQRDQSQTSTVANENVVDSGTRPAEESKAAATKPTGSDCCAPAPSLACFEPLSAQLDSKSKFVALKASLEKQFNGAPELLEPICNKLVDFSRQIEQLKHQNECQQREIGKLRLIKDRLGDLCRELQKSNNQIRIDSLGLIRTEQQKAKEQADKIQTTLAGVMKLFDENQQRNLGLKQENLDLQAKLKQLLEHCDNYEQCVETAIKQRDIENRLLKTELTRASLVKAEEQERFMREKQQLLKSFETMRQHQNQAEVKEAKLRSDLSSYANKYNQCQEMIQNGLGKFQLESKRMLSQIERSRQDYVTLLNKYEASNKKIKQLLEEKHQWMKDMAQTNKKLVALEKLCRSLKADNDQLTRGEPTDDARLLPAGAKQEQGEKNGDGRASSVRQTNKSVGAPKTTKVAGSSGNDDDRSLVSLTVINGEPPKS